jgi:hypothetical protein
VNLAADFAQSPEMQALEAAAGPYANTLRHLDARHAADKVPVFQRDTVADVTTATSGSARRWAPTRAAWTSSAAWAR